MMTFPKAEEQEDWQRKNIFRTRVLHDEKARIAIIDGGSTKNMISKEAVTKLKLPTKRHPHPYIIARSRIHNEVLNTSRCLVKFSIGKVLNMRFGVTCLEWMLAISCLVLCLFNHDMAH